MANAFNLLRSNDLIWPYVINNYLKGKAPMPFDLLYWNSDATRMPAANHSFYLRNCYLENALTKGKMEIDGEKLDLEEDQGADLQPRHPRGSHRAGEIGVSRLEVFRRAGEVRAVRAPATSPAWSIRRARESISTGPAPSRRNATLDDWLAKAEEHPGSWWPDWLAWLKAQDDDAGAGAQDRAAASSSQSRMRPAAT